MRCCILGLLVVCLAHHADARVWLPFIGAGLNGPDGVYSGSGVALGLTTPLETSLPLEVTGGLTGVYDPYRPMEGCYGYGPIVHRDGWLSGSAVFRIVARRSERPPFSAPEIALGVGLHQFWQVQQVGYDEHDKRLAESRQQLRVHLLFRAPFGYAESSSGPVIDAEGQANLDRWHQSWAPDFSLQAHLGFRFPA